MIKRIKTLMKETHLTFIFGMMYAGKYDSFFVYAITTFRAEVNSDVLFSVIASSETSQMYFSIFPFLLLSFTFYGLQKVQLILFFLFKLRTFFSYFRCGHERLQAYDFRFFSFFPKFFSILICMVAIRLQWVSNILSFHNQGSSPSTLSEFFTPTDFLFKLCFWCMKI